MTAFVSAQQAARTAYTAAGIAPDDLDLAELYAPCTIGQVLVSEAMGLAPRGRGAAAAAAGETELGGRIPICTSGGCLARGHPARKSAAQGKRGHVRVDLGGRRSFTETRKTKEKTT